MTPEQQKTVKELERISTYLRETGMVILSEDLTIATGNINLALSQTQSALEQAQVKVAKLEELSWPVCDKHKYPYGTGPEALKEAK